MHKASSLHEQLYRFFPIFSSGPPALLASCHQNCQLYNCYQNSRKTKEEAVKKLLSWSDRADLLEKALSGDGVFLVVLNKDGKANAMTIGWGEMGIVWSRPVFTVLVRHSRYTYSCLQSSESFTVNVPGPNTLKEELLFCGTKSGSDIDKVAACGLTLAASEEVNTPIIEECALHYECRILLRKQLEEVDFSSSKILQKYYKENDHHMLVIGEILLSYAEDSS